MSKEGHLLLTAAVVVVAYAVAAVQDIRGACARRQRERAAALLEQAYLEGYLHGLRQPPDGNPRLRPVE